jgi:hypothetical protein
MVPQDVRTSNLTSASQLSNASCVPHAGDGLVARWGDILLVVADAEDPAVAPLLEQCEAVAEAGGDGRVLSRHLAGFLATYELEPPAFAAAAPVTTGLAVFVQGAAEVVVGDDFTVSGAASLAWVDRLIPWPVTTLTLRARSATKPAPGPYNLQNGIVPGGGLTLHTVPTAESSPVPTSRSAGEQPAIALPPEIGSAQIARKSQPEQAVPAHDRWPGQVAEPPPFESVVMDLGVLEEDEDAPRAPLPVVSKSSDEPPVSTGPVVRGVYCKNGHFNDARVPFCAVCGINMVQKTPVLTEGPRPPLGVLLLDDGTAFQLDADYVLGRDPMHDVDVRSGRLRGITLIDPDRSVSRAHARIELRQWDVVLIDNSSANGTYVAAEGASSWTPLPPGTPHVLSSGSRIRLGSRRLAFNSYRGE